MKRKADNQPNSISLLLRWAGKSRVWLIIAVVLSAISGLCTMLPYYGLYQVIAALTENACTTQVIVQNAIIIGVGLVLRFGLFGISGVCSHKGAYSALYKVRCMVAEHMAKVPLGYLNERSVGDIKTVLNEDIEKLELFLAHNLPEFIHYMIGPVAIFIYLCTVNVALAFISLIPLILSFVVMMIMFSRTKSLLPRANLALANMNSVVIEYISGMKQIKAYNMGSDSFKKYSDAIHEENDCWNVMSKRMGPGYGLFVVLLECGMILMVPIGGLFFLNESITMSVFLLEGLLSGANFIILYYLFIAVFEGNLQMSRLLLLAGIMLIVFILRAISYTVGYICCQIGGASISKNIRLALGNKMKKIPLGRFMKGQTGEYINITTTNVSDYEVGLTHKVGDTIKQSTLAIMLIAYVFTLWYVAGLIMLVAALLMFPALLLSTKLVAKYGNKKVKICAENVSSIVEYTSGIQTLRAYGMGGEKNKTVTKAMKSCVMQIRFWSLITAK